VRVNLNLKRVVSTCQYITVVVDKTGSSINTLTLVFILQEL